MKTKTFTVKIEDKETEVLVRAPSLNDQREAQKVYNQAFTDAIKSKSVVRAKLDDLLVDQGLWDDEKQAKFTGLQKELAEGEKRLAKGGFGLKEAKDLAIKMKAVRDDIRDLISVRTSLDNHSAEGQADNARFNYLVSACTEEVALLGAQHLANMLYGLDNDYENNLPENKFLKKYKFVDEKLRLIDKKGRLIDEDGRLVNEEGRYIDEEGNLVDKYGNKVDEDGEFVVDAEPFLDEDGNPILLEDEEAKNEEKQQEPSTEETKDAPAEEEVTSVEPAVSS